MFLTARKKESESVCTEDKNVFLPIRAAAVGNEKILEMSENVSCYTQLISLFTFRTKFRGRNIESSFLGMIFLRRTFEGSHGDTRVGNGPCL